MSIFMQRMNWKISRRVSYEKREHFVWIEKKQNEMMKSGERENERSETEKMERERERERTRQV